VNARTTGRRWRPRATVRRMPKPKTVSPSAGDDEAELVAAVFAGGADVIVNNEDATVEQLLVAAALCHGDLNLIGRLDLHQHCTAAVIDRALQDTTSDQWDDPWFRLGVAGLWWLPLELHPRLARDSDPAVAIRMAGRWELSEAASDILIRRGLSIRIALAANWSLGSSVAMRCARSRSMPVRRVVALTTNHPRVLRRLLTDQDEEVVSGAARNSRTTTDMLEMALAGTARSDLRLVLEKHLASLRRSEASRT